MHWTEEFFDEYYLKSNDTLTDENHTKKEIDFILKKINPKKNAAILDLACGYGRHSIELAKRGFTNVTGSDFKLPFIEIARKNAEKMEIKPEFKQENMLDFDGDRQYDLIYNLFSSLFYFNDKHNLSIIGHVFKALKENGYFVIDYFNPFSFLKKDIKRHWFITADETIILEKYAHNPVSGMISFERLIITPDGQRVKRMYHLRDYSVAELRYHFENTGFEIIDVCGDFEGNKYGLDSPRQIFVLLKPKRKS